METCCLEAIRSLPPLGRRAVWSYQMHADNMRVQGGLCTHSWCSPMEGGVLKGEGRTNGCTLFGILSFLRGFGSSYRRCSDTPFYCFRYEAYMESDVEKDPSLTLQSLMILAHCLPDGICGFKSDIP